MFKLSEKDRYREAWCEAVFGKKARFPREFTDAQLRRLTNDLLMQHDDGMLRLKPFCDSEQLAVISEAEEILRRLT